MTKFKEFWTKKSHDIPIQSELDDVKEDVHELDEEVDRYEDAEGNLKPGVHVDKNTVHITYDRNGVPVNSYVTDEGINKGMFPQFQVQKPGTSIHSAEWDKCVKDAGDAKNAYAVCTAQLGESSFKSQFKHMAYAKALLAKARKAMGIGFGGGVPHSLLARQDLEEDKTKSDVDDASLYQLKDEARNTDTKEEKEEVTDKIKEVQVKRQKATLKERGVTKSFRAMWNTLSYFQ